jgi:hypothetical protein
MKRVIVSLTCLIVLINKLHFLKKAATYSVVTFSRIFQTLVLLKKFAFLLKRAKSVLLKGGGTLAADSFPGGVLIRQKNRNPTSTIFNFKKLNKLKSTNLVELG